MNKLYLDKIRKIKNVIKNDKNDEYMPYFL